MNIVGQYIGVWMTDAALSITLGRIDEPPVPDKWWTIIGKIEAETLGEGVWVATEEISTRDNKEKVDSGKGDAGATLIRWSNITGAIVWAQKPKQPFIGFQSKR